MDPLQPAQDGVLRNDGRVPAQLLRKERPAGLIGTAVAGLLDYPDRPLGVQEEVDELDRGFLVRGVLGDAG